MRRQMIVVRHFGTQICNFHLAMGFMLGFQFLCLIWSVLSLGRSFFLFPFSSFCAAVAGHRSAITRRCGTSLYDHCADVSRCSRDTGTLLSCIIQLGSNDGEHNTTMIQTRYNQHFHTIQQLWHRDHPRYLSVSYNKDCTGFDSRSTSCNDNGKQYQISSKYYKPNSPNTIW